MTERRPRADDDAAVGEQSPGSVEREAAQPDQHSYAPQCRSLFDEVRVADGDLVGSGLVVRRRAAHGRGDERVAQDQAIVGPL